MPDGHGSGWDLRGRGASGGALRAGGFRRRRGACGARASGDIGRPPRDAGGRKLALRSGESDGFEQQGKPAAGPASRGERGVPDRAGARRWIDPQPDPRRSRQASRGPDVRPQRQQLRCADLDAGAHLRGAAPERPFGGGCVAARAAGSRGQQGPRVRRLPGLAGQDLFVHELGPRLVERHLAAAAHSGDLTRRDAEPARGAGGVRAGRPRFPDRHLPAGQRPDAAGRPHPHDAERTADRRPPRAVQPRSERRGPLRSRLLDGSGASRHARHGPELAGAARADRPDRRSRLSGVDTGAGDRRGGPQPERRPE